MIALPILLLLVGSIFAAARWRELRGMQGGYWALRFVALAVVAFFFGALHPAIPVLVWLAQLVWLGVTFRRELKLRSAHLQEIGYPRA
jgi:fatty acid desaturase